MTETVSGPAPRVSPSSFDASSAAPSLPEAEALADPARLVEAVTGHISSLTEAEPNATLYELAAGVVRMRPRD